MKFGLLFEMQRPFEGNDVDWNLLYRETLDQCEPENPIRKWCSTN